MEEKVFSYIEEHSMIEAGDRVIVGVSGGADSVCLLFLLMEYRKRVNFSVHAVHVNHQLRGQEAERDQQFVESLCSSLNIPCSVYSYQVSEMAERLHMTVEEAGRTARQKAFLEASGRKEKAVTALAHHRDDLAETVLHNLARGSGVAGLVGIHPIRMMEEATYIRPLLCVGRREIEEWLRARQISWMEDSTNSELSYTRNKIRHKVLPDLEEINPRASQHIARAAGTFYAVEEYLKQQADMLYNRYVSVQDLESGSLRIDRGLFTEHPVMQSYVVREALACMAGGRKDITAAHIDAVTGLSSGKTGNQVSLSYGITGTSSYGNIFLSRGEETEASEKELEFEIFPFENQQIPGKKYTKWFDYDKIVGNLTVRKRLAGDYLTVNETGGRKKLKDYFIDCKIPRQERDTLTLLADGSHIIWVVGYRISEYYKVTARTKTVIKVHVKGESEDE